jgi:nucleoid-associated protein YgaU
MPEPDPPSKLTITNLTTNTSQECKFNPNQLSLNKRVSWERHDTKKKNVSQVSFGGGHPATMSLDLFFDTTDTGEDVRTKYTDFLLGLLEIDETKKDANGKPLHEPPDCRLTWGSVLSLIVVFESVDVTFTFFLGNGTPVRATAKLSLKQKIDEQVQSRQNPTTRSEARKTWIVHEGETLDWIAYQEYGNSAYWRHIAQTNDLANPRVLRAGQVLKLVPLP